MCAQEDEHGHLPEACGWLSSRLGSDSSKLALLPRDGIAPDSRHEGCVSSQRQGRSWAKGSSHGAVSTDWNGEKTLHVPGAQQHSPARWKGRRVSLESQEFCSSQAVGCGHCGNLEMPTGGFGLGQGRGLFPDCDGHGCASSCWRHHFPARHSTSWDLWLRPQSCLIRSNHS